MEALRDAMIDRWYDFDFGGLIKADAVVSAHASAMAQVTSYQAVTGLHLRLVISEALRTGINFSHFVDIGAGKGRACLYAAREFNFPAVMGVDLSPPLVDIARANAAKARATDVQFLVADATLYDLPAGDNLVFLYNPFKDVALDAFLARNLAHFRNNRSVIAYVNDRYRASLIEFGFETLYRDQVLKLSVYRMPQGKIQTTSIASPIAIRPPSTTSA
jgi:SAM-dependent methyltransferase